jgi:DMSO reductase family type II enzyme chaperone
VTEQVLQGLDTPEQQLAAARSRTYGVFAGAIEYPDAELCELIRSGTLAQGLREALGAVDAELVEGIDWEALRDAGEGEDDLAVEYTRLFDVGASGPPCPLYGGLYVGARMKTMEEAVRFYNHFGLSMAEKPRELPDHITTELEFLHYLSFREAEALQTGGDAGAFRRAQRDFVARHPGRWIPKLRQRLEQQEPMRFLREFVRQLDRFIEHERQYLTQLAGPAPEGSPPTPG